ncbi:hypothetical protein KVG29_08725 [Caldicoprobacter algeriensis]|uniref:hypothetical protein n=1 Tax=Caldicoprobacter algeriensis TaxID=699281 RepID=UPI00207AE5EC|nr:hypothetical protein [Caldicoprobacter algeriensis]MCM8901302.1 hypothetical protein [Caldicoprobacter algeriensis]
MIKLTKEPPKRRLRIKNKTRFVLFITLLIITSLMIFIPKESRSNIEYKPYRVAFGDTYWHIAMELQEAGYRPWAEIRDIVHELVKVSGIPAHELKEGDTIYIPDLKEGR